MHRLLLSAVLALATSALVVPQVSLAGHGGKSVHHGWMSHHSPLIHLEKIAASDKISDEQRSQIRGLADKHRAELRKQGDAMRAAKRELHAQMKSETPDAAAIRAAAEAKGKAMGELLVIRTQIRSEMKSILTEEQRDHFKRYCPHDGKHGGSYHHRKHEKSKSH